MKRSNQESSVEIDQEDPVRCAWSIARGTKQQQRARETTPPSTVLRLRGLVKRHRWSWSHQQGKGQRSVLSCCCNTVCSERCQSMSIDKGSWEEDSSPVSSHQGRRPISAAAGGGADGDGNQLPDQRLQRAHTERKTALHCTSLMTRQDRCETS